MPQDARSASGVNPSTPLDGRARYYLSDADRRGFERRARWSALAEDERPGHFRLYNKNASTTLHVRVVGQVPNAMIWLVECEGDVPEYFRAVLTPVHEGDAG